MRVNIPKSKFFAVEIGYLDHRYWITRQGVRSIDNKVGMNAMIKIKAPKTRKVEKKLQFIGIVNYYRDMWFGRSDWLALHQARSSLNGTHPINRSVIKSRKSRDWKFLLCYPDLSLVPFIFIQMHQMIN
jgi:hypothetical protein